MVKKCINWCLVAAFCLLMVPTTQGATWSMAKGQAAATELTRDFTALALDGTAGSSTVKQELGAFTTLVFGCYTCYNSTSTISNARTVLDSLGFHDYPVILLDIKDSAMEDVKTAQSNYSNIILSVVTDDSTAKSAYSEITKTCYPDGGNTSTMPAMVILDAKGTPVYCSSNYDTSKSLYQEVIIDLTDWTEEEDNNASTDKSTFSITGTNVNYPSQTQIASYYNSKNLGTSATHTETYATEPSFTSPYVSGSLSTTTLNHVLNTFNYVRYVAGLPYNVTTTTEYNTLAQDASYLNYLNDSMSHTPETPAVLSGSAYSDLVESGKLGAKSSNIASGYSNLSSIITTGWMNDGDSSNIEIVGHRRWILNPSMTATGFGLVKGTNYTQSAMYAFDLSGGTTSTKGVMWPAQNMPLDLFGSEYPWTFSTGTAISGTVTVTLTRLNDDKVWTFSNSDTDKEGKYFNIENQSYGLAGCVIFRPDPSDIRYQGGDVFRVEIKGAVTASYCVSFFDVNEVSGSTSNLTPTTTPSSVTLDIGERAVSVTGLSLSASKTDLEVGETATVTATISPSNATNKAVSWKSTNTNVATVSNTGKVTAVGKGTATIYATTEDGGKTSSVLFTVSESSDSSDDSSSGDSSSGDSSSGDSSSGDSSSDDSNSSVSVTGIRVSQSTASLSVGTSFSLTATLSPSNATTTGVSWTSSDSSVATVSSSGKVTAVGKGTATITATTEDGGKTASCAVTVTPELDTNSYCTSVSRRTSGSTSAGGTVELSSNCATSGTEIKIYVSLNPGFVLSSITLTTEDNSPVPLSVASGGAYFYFTQPASDTDLTLHFTSQSTTTAPGLTFSDVASTDWYYEYVFYVSTGGLMSGTSTTTFGADEKTERSMIVTTLYNMAGKSPVSSYVKFTDISTTDYFYTPCIWANQQGIVNGVDETRFDPYTAVTREEICLILYKYATTQTNLVSGTAPNANFTDSGSISAWAKEGVNWCSSLSIVNGKVDGSFDPSASASRGEIATMLTKFSMLMA